MSYTLPQPGVPGYRSPLLDLPGAVPASGVDAGVALHYGDPLGEQRALAEDVAFVDYSQRTMFHVTGPDRLALLHAVTTQDLAGLPEATSARTLVLDQHAHVRYDMVVTELGGQTWVTADAAMGAVLDYLRARQYQLRVDVGDVTADWAPVSLIGPRSWQVLAQLGVPRQVPPNHVTSLAGAGWVWRLAVPRGDVAALIVPRPMLAQVARRLVALGVRPAGMGPFDMLRVVRPNGRVGFEVDDHTYPHEVGMQDTVSMRKRCYPGSTALQRVLAADALPRRLVRLRLSVDHGTYPTAGTPVVMEGRRVGHVGTAGTHYVLGPVATAVVERGIPDSAPLSVDGLPAPVDDRP